MNNMIQKFLHYRHVIPVMLVIITISFVSSYSKIYDVKLDFNGDNIHYYALGQALATGKGFTDIMSFTETPHTHFPPGYPVFVAGVMKIFPDNINAIKIANGLLLYASILLLFFLLKKLSGDLLLSFLACFFCTLHAEILRYATIMMSEMLFLFCTIGALYLALSIKIEALFTKKGIKNTIFLGLLLSLINYIYFVRTMGTSIILAIIIYSGILLAKQLYIFLKKKNSPQLLYKYGIVFVLLVVSFWGTKTAWDIRNRNVGKITSDYIGDFKKKTNGQVMTTWEDWTTRIKNNFNSYLAIWIPNAVLNTNQLSHKAPTSGDIFRGTIVALLILWGLISLSQGALLLFLYLGATVAVLLVWPEQYGGLRYFIAIIPFFIFLFFNGIKAASLTFIKATKLKIAEYLPSACILILALLFMTPAYSEALKEKKELAKYKTWNADIAGNAFMEFTAAMQWCGDNLPDSARVICRKPELFYMYSGGKKSSGFSQYGKPEDILKQLIYVKATHVIIDHWFRHAYVTLFPLISTHYPEKFKPIGKFENKYNPKEPPTWIFEFNPEWGYHGELVDGKRQGKGTFLFPNGQTYVGQFENNQRNGYGEILDKDGNIITKGIWRNDTLSIAQ